jgi:hypothetical protein
MDASGNLTDDHTLQPGETIDLVDFAGNVIDFSAISSDSSATGSVMFSIDTATPVSFIDDSAPYLLGGRSHFDVGAGAIVAGTYTLSATPYSEANGNGDAGETYSVSFTIDAIEPVTSEIEWLLIKNQYVAVTNDVDNCLDRDYDNHKSIFCGDGFDNNQDGLTDYEDSVNCLRAAAPITYHVNAINYLDARCLFRLYTALPPKCTYGVMHIWGQVLRSSISLLLLRYKQTITNRTIRRAVSHYIPWRSTGGYLSQ